MVSTAAVCLAGIIAAQRLIELFIARRNLSYLQSIGGQEFNAGHYPLFFVLHCGWFAGWIFEAMRGGTISSSWPVWLALFISAQGLRYWCMVSLGRFWNTRILVVPGYTRIKCGPYRLISHPNYWAVCVELAAVPLLFDAFITATAVSLCNAVLLLIIRIPAEERALQQLL